MQDYVENVGPDGRRRDADQRPELCRGSVEFVATQQFMVRTKLCGPLHLEGTREEAHRHKPSAP